MSTALDLRSLIIVQPSAMETLKLSKSIDCPKCKGKGKVLIINGAFLRQHRERTLQISLRELARDIGISAAYLSDVELGRRTASAKIVEGYGL